MAEEDIQLEAPAKASKGVLCAKCDHLNPGGRDKCEYCQAHLYVNCQSCKTRNQRVASRCSKCGHHLHRSEFKRWWKRWSKKEPAKIAAQVGLGLVGAVVAFKLIVKIAESKLPF